MHSWKWKIIKIKIKKNTLVIYKYAITFLKREEHSLLTCEVKSLKYYQFDCNKYCRSSNYFLIKREKHIIIIISIIHLYVKVTQEKRHRSEIFIVSFTHLNKYNFKLSIHYWFVFCINIFQCFKLWDINELIVILSINTRYNVLVSDGFYSKFINNIFLFNIILFCQTNVLNW